MAYPFDGSWQRAAMSVGGSVFFVSSTSANKADSPANGGSTSLPFATITYAITQCTAGMGDVVYVMPGHTEAVTATVAVNKSGVEVLGMGRGRLRPTLTPSGAIACMTISAANCHVDNIRFVGAAASVTSQISVTAAGTDALITNCFIEQGVTPVSAIVVAAAADRLIVRDTYFLGTANGPTDAISFVGKVSNWIVDNCFFNYQSFGVDNAVIQGATDKANPGGIFRNCVAIGLDAATLIVDFNSSVSLGEGLLVNIAMQTRANATIANLYDLGGYGTALIQISDGPNRGAILHPSTSPT